MGLREDLITRRDNIGTELAAVKNTDQHWTAYKQGLWDELERLTKMLKDPAIDQTATSDIGPYEGEITGST